MLIKTKRTIDQVVINAEAKRDGESLVNPGQKKGGLDVSTGLNDQISQMGAVHIYYLMAPSALSLAGTFPSGSLNFPGT